MKVELLTFWLLVICNAALGQDTIVVNFSEERDTLSKQHFVDRYENIFMTKVPTRNMFKLSAVSSHFAGIGAYAGYEYKVRPALSLEAGVYGQIDRLPRSLYPETSRLHPLHVAYWAILKARWYLNMQKRIKSGLNSNNFTGMYLGMSHEYLFKDGISKGVSSHITGLAFGFKSRFLHHGYMDISLNLYNRQLGLGASYRGERQGVFTPKHFVLSTQKTFGIAFGDWKRNPNPALCDVLVCDETIASQWKIGLPEISVGLLNQMASMSAAYEMRIGKTPSSIQAMNETSFFRFSKNTLRGELSTSLQLRYYFLQNIKINKGAGGYNFSGLYLSCSGEHYLSWNGQKAFALTNRHFYNQPAAKLGLGYQQRLFRKVFFDGSVLYRESYPTRKWTNAGAPHRIGAFHSRFSIGFAF
ncbi:hypothetical protein [Dyadobacter sp. 676]|uniref:Uncharacterized protein n=1 Tax=Dyadobacter sp. 676 TaxID=3088362 RepID=A0AAU8FJF6_9BACT